MAGSDPQDLTPEQIVSASFESRFRGLDADAVSDHLKRVADSVRALQSDNEALRAEVERLTTETASLEETVAEQAEPDEAMLTERLGHEAARVLSEARSAAADRITEAEAEADDIRADAEGLYAERSQIADAEADRIRAEAASVLDRRSDEASAQVEAIEVDAQREAAAIRAGAETDRQASDAEGARIIREAQVARRQILEDLARRRSSARRQIEQLRAGRERLLASHEMVRRTLDEVTEELNISMSEARAAAETAGHTVSESTVEELETEIETARLSGLLDIGPVPVVDDTARPEQGAVIPEKPTDRTFDRADKKADKAPPDDDLAKVVELDSARSEVDTGSHPAARRAKPAEPAGDSRSGRGLLAVAPIDVEVQDLDDAEGVRVEDLFARMRSGQEKPAEGKAIKANDAEMSAADKLSAEEAPADVEPPDVSDLAGELARKLKRVLADEQSGVLSSLQREDTESVDELLGELSAHTDRYWNVARASAIEAFTVAAPDSAPEMDDIDPLRDGITDLVTGLRSRVESVLGADGDSGQSAVERLRGVYREVKTRRIGEHAQSVCAEAAGIGAARGKDTVVPQD